jgi:osmotically-inducible protein OsmY
MDIRIVALGVLASAFILWGPLFNPALAMEPQDASVPTHASNSADDNRVTQQIKSALMADESLSPQGKRIIVATNSEAVVLRGAVSGTDKDRIETLAGQYAGARQVDSQLTVRDY